ncbi:MAG: hypothetical protein ACLPXB_18575 [Thiobacillaceae bacterium]
MSLTAPACGLQPVAKPAKPTAVPRSCLVRSLLAIGAMMGGVNAQATAIAIVLSDNFASYGEVFGTVASNLGGENNVVRLPADQPGVAAARANAASLLITGGVRAAESVVGNFPRTPRIAALVPRESYGRGGQGPLAASQGPASAVFLDQPFSCQRGFVRGLMPEASRIGVVLSAAQTSQRRELQAQAKRSDLTIVDAILGPNQSLVASLEKGLPASQELLALPDPEVFNRRMAETIFITTYLHRVPMVGYSDSLTREGALVSLYSSPAPLGQHVVQLAFRAISGSDVKLSPSQFPKFYAVSAKPHVARLLGVTLQDDASLLKDLHGGRVNRD